MLLIGSFPQKSAGEDYIKIGSGRAAAGIMRKLVDKKKPSPEVSGEGLEYARWSNPTANRHRFENWKLRRAFL
ncbi:MAG: hypothetical protein WBC44_00335 [Planctomycetaceae bacterium]